MTYEEFKEKVEALGIYKLEDTGAGCSDIYLDANYEEEDYLMGSVSHEQRYTMDIMADCKVDIELIRLMLEYVTTPVEDRYPVKKYYVKLEALRFIDEEKVYLNRYRSVFRTTQYEFDTKNKGDESMIDYQTQFTMEEIEEIIPKEDMEKFQFIPVEED